MLTPESVLQKITSFDIFRHFMGAQKWELNEATISPFLHKGGFENNPSFVIGNRYGDLHFIDFSLPDNRGDCFTFVKLLYNLSSMDDVLKLIDREFGLGICSEYNVGKYKKIVSEYKQPEELGKRYSVIQVTTRKFTKEELAYWDTYHISLQELRDNHIYSIDKMFLNRQRFPLSNTELRFGYYFPSGGFWKIYRPTASKKNKWISNVPLITTYGKENLNKEKNTLIVDSLKDYIICRKVYDNVIQVQNESMSSVSDETVEYINSNSKEVFVGFDSDEAGKSASWMLTNTFKWKHINTPDNLLPATKDWADMIRSLGIEAIENHFKLKKLIE